MIQVNFKTIEVGKVNNNDSREELKGSVIDELNKLALANEDDWIPLVTVIGPVSPVSETSQELKNILKRLKENNKMIQVNFKTIEVGTKVEKDGKVVGIENTKMYRVPTKAEAVHKYMTEHKIEDTKLLLIQEIEEEWEELD